MATNKKRILIIDDMADIHDDFYKILVPRKKDSEFEKLKAELFTNHENEKSAEAISYEIDSAYQGQEGVELVKKAVANKHPYALAFVDIRMPPGWNGIETIKHIWQIDPNLQIVICTAHSDYSWETIAAQLAASDNFLILKKPFDPIEITQLAAALTKKWELHRALHQQIESLETIVAQRTAALFKAKQMAENSNLIKSDFLRNMSHELLTPLNGIVGFAQVLHAEQNLADQHKEYTHAILSSANHLSQLINDVFYMSSIETHEFDPKFKAEDIDLAHLIDEIRDMLRTFIKEKQLQLHVDIDAKVSRIVNDVIQLKRVLFHLISNAVKFSPQHGKIQIRAFPVENAQMRIEVTDFGIGIPLEEIHKLFVPFKQLDSSMSKKYQGLGIGLALARHIVESQGGQVGFENNYAVSGSTFFITLPLHKHP